MKILHPGEYWVYAAHVRRDKERHTISHAACLKEDASDKIFQINIPFLVAI